MRRGTISPIYLETKTASRKRREKEEAEEAVNNTDNRVAIRRAGGIDVLKAAHAAAPKESGLRNRRGGRMVWGYPLDPRNSKIIIL
jgi:hypothetical protein